MKKFDFVNPVIGKLAMQVKASKLTDYQLTKKKLQQGEIDELQLKLDKLKYGVKKNDDNDNNNNTGRGCGGGGRTPGLPGPPTTPQQEMDDIVRRLDYLRGNTPDVSPYNAREQNSRIVAQNNNEKFVNQQIKQRQIEIFNLPKGTVNKGKSSMNFNFPETPLKRHKIKKKIIGVTLNKTGLALLLSLLSVAHLSFLTLIVIFCLFQDNQLCQMHLNQGKLVFIS